MFDATEVVPINFVFFTASAILAGLSIFYVSPSLYAAFSKCDKLNLFFSLECCV